MLHVAVRSALMLVVMIAALVVWSRIPNPKRRFFMVLGALMALGILVELIGYVTMLKHMNNSLLYNVYSLVECALVLQLVVLVRARSRMIAAVTLGVVVLTSAIEFWSVGADFGNSLHASDVVIAMLLTVLTLATLWHLSQTSEQPLQRVPEFWVFMGLLMYFGGMSPILALVDPIYRMDKELAKQLYLIMPVLCMIRYGFLIFACYQERAQRSIAE